MAHTCADASCATSGGCEDDYGRCVDTYCDQRVVNPTYVCTQYLKIGESCDNNWDACDTRISYCTWDSVDARKECTAYTPIGGTCSGDGQCNDAVAYCDSTLGQCVLKLADGAGCESGSQCSNGYCYGACSGGTNDTLPCDTSSYCPSGTCAGQCSAWDDSFAYCSP